MILTVGESEVEAVPELKTGGYASRTSSFSTKACISGKCHFVDVAEGAWCARPHPACGVGQREPARSFDRPGEGQAQLEGGSNSRPPDPAMRPSMNECAKERGWSPV